MLAVFLGATRWQQELGPSPIQAAPAFSTAHSTSTVTHKDTGATGEYDLEAVPNMPEQAKVATTALMFPLHGTYRAQVVAYSGTTPMLRSTVESIVVLNNE